MASGQINVRVAESLRVQGNLALEEAGWSPSRAIRAIWQFAAQHKGNPAELRRTLERLEGNPRKSPTERMRLIEEGRSIVDNGMTELGLSISPELANLSYNELREMAYGEMLKEMGNDQA